MHIRSLQFIVLFVFYSIISFSQTRDCGSDKYLAWQLGNAPERYDVIDQIEKHTRFFLNNEEGRSISVITIPVVVHIVYNENGENITDDQVKSQIAVLNEDFRRLNKDAEKKWSQAADMEIEFCLASLDPFGKTTNGITRTFTNSTSFNTTGDDIKYSGKGGKDAWPASKYLNIWVCDITGTVLGFAQFPGGKPETDGIVIDYKCFGKGIAVSAPFHLGRTATHEVGHWLNLKHIWGASDCITDDLVSDTPMSDGPNYNCSKGHISCGNVNMVENYLDYSNDDCMNLFTAGQKARMKALFSAGGFRNSIILSDGCGTIAPPAYCDKISVQILLDNYPQETSWEIHDTKGIVVMKSQKYVPTQKNSLVKIDTCLIPGCYEFVINDAYSDGICCKYGQGNYKLLNGNILVAQGGGFGKTANHSFCIVGKEATCTDGIKNGNETATDCGGDKCNPCPTCFDGIKNGLETDIDCGGSNCSPCSTGGGTTSGNLIGSYFETGWDNWNGGATDTERYFGDYAWEGDYAIMIRDNSGEESAMTSPELDLRSFSQIKIEFAFYGYSMEETEDFWLMYYDGVKWNKLKGYSSGQDFYNNTFYNVTFIMTRNQYAFVQKSKFRFQCDASTNADQIYIDAVKITGTPEGSINTETQNKVSTVGIYIGENKGLLEPQIRIFPNPAFEVLDISSDAEMHDIKILDLTGKLHREISLEEDHIQLDISTLTPGVYLVNIVLDNTVISRRLVKK